MAKKLFVSAMLVALLTPISAAADGAKLYKPCAACHLSNGQGVPASFPPLNQGIDKLAMNEAGRNYLIAVIKYGVAGKLETEAGTFRGFMPAQSAGRNSQNITDVLNYILTNFYPEQNTESFTATEVEEKLKALGKLKPRDVAASRPN